jgi:hypothetical protein
LRAVSFALVSPVTQVTRPASQLGLVLEHEAAALGRLRCRERGDVVRRDGVHGVHRERDLEHCTQWNLMT